MNTAASRRVAHLHRHILLAAKSCSAQADEDEHEFSTDASDTLIVSGEVK